MILQTLFAFFRPPAWVRWTIVLIYSVAVTWLMLAPSEMFIDLLWSFPHVDKLLHFCLYGFLVWLIRWAVAAHHQGSLKAGFISVVLAGIGYGIAMEIAQSLLAGYGRSFEWLDIAANSLGAVCFWFLWELGVAWLNKRQATEAPDQVTDVSS